MRVAITAALLGLLTLAAPAWAQNVQVWDQDGFSCADMKVLDAVYKALAQKDTEFALHLLNTNDCPKTLKGQQYIITERRDWLTFRYRRPGSFSQYWKSR